MPCKGPAGLLKIEDRAGLRSTLLTSQLPVAMWHDAIGEPTLADSILDRLTSGLVRVEMSGESMRRAPATAAKQARRRAEEAEGTNA